MWRSPENDWQVIGAVSNLTDELYHTGRFDSRTGFGYATSTVAAPRQYSLTLRKNFQE